MQTEAMFIRDGELRLEPLELPPLGAREILVNVAAAGVNRADLLQRRGFYPAPPGVPADVPGLEYSGLVAEIGSSVSRWKLGDRVMGIVGGGAMSRQVLVDEREAIAVPQHLSLHEAAAIPEAFLTAHDAMLVQAGLQKGDNVLIHAVASGVGTAASQLAKGAAATVFGTSRSEEKLTRAAKFGLDHGVVAKNDSFADQLSEKMDVILDCVGAAYFEQNLSLLKARGRLVIIGMLGGANVELPLPLLLSGRLKIIGTVLRSRSLEEKIAVVERFNQDAGRWLLQGSLQPVIDAVLPMREADEAHRRMAANETFGKLVLAWR